MVVFTLENEARLHYRQYVDFHKRGKSDRNRIELVACRVRVTHLTSCFLYVDRMINVDQLIQFFHAMKWMSK